MAKCIKVNRIRLAITKLDLEEMKMTIKMSEGEETYDLINNNIINIYNI